MPKVIREIFGHLPDGAAIELVRLRGDNGFEVRLITYGAAIQSIFARIARGGLPMWCSAATASKAILRYGASSAHRRTLCQPDRQRHVRTGRRAVSIARQRRRQRAAWRAGRLRPKTWTITAIGEEPAPFVTLSYVSADGEEGYPGRLEDRNHLQHFRRHRTFGRILGGDRQADRRQPDQSQLLQSRRRRGRRRHSRSPRDDRGG